MTLSPLHPQLARDSITLGHLGSGRLLLMSNAHYPWFVLVPDTAATELHELDADLQARVVNDINRVSRFVRQRFPVDKLNVAAIGNIVPQLHIHVVGRRRDDPAWPGVVWGHPQQRPYDDAELERIGKLVSEDLLETI